MKKQTPKSRKKKSSRKKSTPAKAKLTPQSDSGAVAATSIPKKVVTSEPRRPSEKKPSVRVSPMSYIGKAGQFLRESRMELKKVKWPTRKELLASTAVVIVLTLIVAFFLGLVDFGLIKIMKTIIR
jgi:preprotein translocase subunit SecE